MDDKNVLLKNTNISTFVFLWYMLILWIYPYSSGRYIGDLMREIPLMVMVPYLLYVLFLMSLASFTKNIIIFDYKKYYENSNGDGVDSEKACVFFYFNQLKNLLALSFAVFLLKSFPSRSPEAVPFIYLNVILILPLLIIYAGKRISLYADVYKKKNKLHGWLAIPVFIISVMIMWSSAADWFATIKSAALWLFSVIGTGEIPVSKPGDLWLILIYILSIIYGVLSLLSVKRNIKGMLSDLRRPIHFIREYLSSIKNRNQEKQ